MKSILQRCLIVSVFLGYVVSSSLFADHDKDDDVSDPNEDRRGSHFEIDDIGRLILGYRDLTYEDVSDELFKRVSTYDFGVPMDGHSTFIGKFRRKVYDNRDGTYSVLDLFGVQGVVSLGDAMEVAGVPIYAAVGAEHGYDFLDIRQVDDKLKIGYQPLTPDDPWYRDLWNEIREQWFGLRYFYEFAQGSWNFFMRYFRSPSDQFSARYEDILNVVQTPFRLPLDAAGFNAMEPGEIISYTILGGVFVSLGGVVKQIPWSAGLNLNFYIRGAYRISILKERDGNFAKIKFSKLLSHGHSFSGRVKGDFDIVEGIIFGSDLSASIVPVRFSMNEADIRIFDTCYRYDMRTSQGIHAYEKAVYGNFILSEEDSSPNVQKPYRRETNGDRDAFEINFNILLWRSQTSYELDNSLITITDTEGVNHVFHSISKNEIQNGNIFHRNHEKIEYFIESTVELESPDSSSMGKDPVVLVSLFITDKDAYGSEIKKYFQLIESLLQDPAYFDEGQYHSEHNYEKMSADIHFKFSKPAIDKILEAPESSLWHALAKAFGVAVSEWETQQKREEWLSVDTYFMALLRDRRSLERIRRLKEAMRISDYFHEIRNERNGKERSKKFAAFHRETPFQWEVLTVMLELSNFENMYGQLRVSGKYIENRYDQWGENILQDRPNEHQDEENELRGRPTTQRATITDIKLSHVEGDDHFRLSFLTPVDPTTIEGFYVRISPIYTWWFRNKPPVEIPREGDQGGLFKEFEWNRGDSRVSIFLERLGLPEPFEIGARYEVSFAFRHEGNWSIQPKLIFKYERKDPMHIQWIDLQN